MSGENVEASQNPSIIQAQAVVDALLEARVQRFAYCPGSRNAPFAYVLSAYEKAGLITVNQFAQESTAAFWALGVAKALGGREPVAVFTTSGSGVSQMHAALEESRHQSLPVITVTADRPFELVGVGASQATRQVGIFGPTTVADLDIPADAPRGIGQRVARLLHRATGFGGRGGPAHINVAFRSPLVPAIPVEVLTRSITAPLVSPAVEPVGGSKWSSIVDPALRTLIVAGDCEPIDYEVARQIGSHACSLGIPILAEPSSGLTSQETWIPHGPLVAPILSEAVQQIIVLGKPTLSRPVAALLAKDGVRKIVVSPHEEWPDAVGNAVEIIAEITLDGSVHHDGTWLEACRDASNAAAETLARNGDEGALDHLSAAHAIWTADPEVNLWLGASNTVRAFDLAAPKPGRNRVFSNRGLAGIDGTIASAMGAQTATEVPLRAVMGDLTFIYDLPALGIPETQNAGRDLQLVVLDDGGGTIFESLEHGSAADGDTLERYFEVPQNVDVCAVAAACGWEVHCVSRLTELEDALRAPVKGRSVLHLNLCSPAKLFETVRNGVVPELKLRKP